MGCETVATPEIAAGSCQDVTRHGSTLALLGYIIDLLRGALSLFLSWLASPDGKCWSRNQLLVRTRLSVEASLMLDLKT